MLFQFLTWSVIGVGGCFLMIACAIGRQLKNGWRPALFSAGFGLTMTGLLMPIDAALGEQVLGIIAASAQVSVGLSALATRVRDRH